MAKRYDETIEVSIDDADWADERVPVAFSWRGKRYFVDERLSTWREAGEWWDSQATHEKEFFRVVAHPAGTAATGELDADGFIVNNSSVYDIYRDRLNGTWRMGRVWD